jgi:transcription termination factor Rho
MSVLDREALDESPLADLHAIASELSIDGYRRLRREPLIDAILARQEGEEPTAKEAPPSRARRGRRGGRSGEREREPEPEPEPDEPAAEEAEEPSSDDQIVEGEVELLPNGSGFLRSHPPEPSEDDVYISAAQVRRCELISGDRIAGPRRGPRRSERFASLFRVDTVNGRPASELADRPRFDDLPAAFPEERFEFDSEDPTLQAIERLTPFGKGSRVTIAGPARAGKTETIKRLAAALAGRDGLQLFVVLAGVRPEETTDWPVEPAQAASFAAPTDVQEQAVSSVINQARRIATRGTDAVVLIDTLDALHHHAARRAMAAARNLREGASLTVVATASQPAGGETTVIALDPTQAALGRFPALELAASGTIRPELLVGEEGAAAIVQARADQ